MPFTNIVVPSNIVVSLTFAAILNEQPSANPCSSFLWFLYVPVQKYAWDVVWWFWIFTPPSWNKVLTAQSRILRWLPRFSVGSYTADLLQPCFSPGLCSSIYCLWNSIKANLVPAFSIETICSATIIPRTRFTVFGSSTIDNSHTIRYVGNISSPSKTRSLASMQDGAFCAWLRKWSIR